MCVGVDSSMGTMEEGAAEAFSRYLRMACRRARFGVMVLLARGRPVGCGGGRVRDGTEGKRRKVREATKMW